MTSKGKDEPVSERHGLDELEPLDEHSERQEPEDDYYIRNYVLREAPEAEKPEQSVGGATDEVRAESSDERVDTSPTRTAVDDAPTPPAFGSQTFGPTPVAPSSRAATVSASDAEESELTRGEQLANTLSRLLESSPEIEAAALVSLDGLAMASALPDMMQEDRVAAMSAAILGLGERASAELGRGALNQVFVEGEDGYVFLMSAGGRAVLTALAGHGAKIGLVFYDLKHAAAKIAEIL